MIFYYLACGYFAVAMWLLYFEDFVKVFKDTYFYWHVIIISQIALFKVL